MTNVIIALRGDRIAEEGTHHSLPHRGGQYAHLDNTYFRHQSPNYQSGEGFVAVRTRHDLASG